MLHMLCYEILLGDVGVCEAVRTEVGNFYILYIVSKASIAVGLANQKL